MRIRKVLRLILVMYKKYILNFFFQSMCFQFINALLTETDDFEFRIHLRNEIVRNGLYSKLGE